jgi:hypothetical protein
MSPLDLVILPLMRVRAAPRVVPLLIGLLRGALFFGLLSVFMSGCYQRLTRLEQV